MVKSPKNNSLYGSIGKNISFDGSGPLKISFMVFLVQFLDFNFFIPFSRLLQPQFPKLLPASERKYRVQQQEHNNSDNHPVHVHLQ
jgi:hypothetical protein